MEQSLRETGFKLLDKSRVDPEDLKTESDKISSSSFLTTDLEISESDSGINMSTESESNLIGSLTGSPLTQLSDNSVKVDSTPLPDHSSFSHGGENIQAASSRLGTDIRAPVQHRIFELDSMDKLPDVYISSSDVDTGREIDCKNQRPTNSRHSARSTHAGDVCEHSVGSIPSVSVCHVSGHPEQNKDGCLYREDGGSTGSRRVRTCSENAAYEVPQGSNYNRDGTVKQTNSATGGLLQSSIETQNQKLLGVQRGLTPRNSATEDTWSEGVMRPRSQSAPTIIEHVVALELRSISDSFNSLYEGSDIDGEVPFIRGSARSSLPLLGANKKSKSFLSIIRRYLPSRSHALTSNLSRPSSITSELVVSAQGEIDEQERVRAARARRLVQDHRSSFSSVPEDDEHDE